VGNQTGNTGSFEQLALPHFASLYNFACWLTQDRAAAEDLVQEAFLKALKGFSSYQQGSNFRAWIYKILRNTFLTTRAGLKATAGRKLPRRFSLPVSSKRPSSARLRSYRSTFARSFCSAIWKR